jgi:hypothetical protein
MEKRAALIEKIFAQYDAGNDIPLVELNDFFEGNNHEASIAPNLVGSGHLGLRRFREILTAVHARTDVDQVLIGIHECPEVDDARDAEVWPSAENVYIYTSAGAGEVEHWVAELKADGAIAGWPYGKPNNAPECMPGHKVIALCWD